MTLSRDRRQRVDAICHAALELPVAARAGFVADACGGDDEIRTEVEALLAHASQTEGFLAEPAGAVAARVMGTDEPGGTPALGAGTRMGSYEIVSPLGAGGMGQVYRARDMTLGREVALKVLTNRAGHDPVVGDRLLREARRAAQLSHPGICQVFHVGESESGPFMVMELVDGATLHVATRSGPMPIERVCRVGREIAEALEHAHAQGIVHRDLKSTNVMLTRAGHAKVLDFGIAAWLPGSDVTRTLTADAGSHAGVAGTLLYMAPEVLQGQHAGIASDIWALGVVLHEMVTGRLPFDGTTPSALVAAILRDPPAPLPPATPSAIALLIRRCLSKAPSERPRRASEIALALDVVSAETSSRPPAATSRRVGMASVGAAIVVVALVVAAAWLMRSRPVPGTGGSLRLQDAVQVTTAVGVEDFPALSPDGRTVAYVASVSGSPAGGDWNIWVTQPGGAPVNRTSDHAGLDLFPSWSPDGAQIAFWSDRDGGGCFVMPAVGGSARRVAAASPLDPNPPIWSDDARQLSCVVGDSQRVDLVTFVISTGEEVRRSSLPGTGRRMFVSPAANGQRVAMIASPAGLGSDLAQLVVVDSATGRVDSLTDEQSKAWSPFWSADGGLYFVWNKTGSADLWRLRFDATGAGGSPEAVSAGVGMRSAASSRDGTKVVYSQGRRVAQVWRVPVLPNRPATWADATQITFDQAYVEFIDVSRDGQRLAISSDRNGSFDLWVMPSGGGDMRQITSDPGAEWAPRWSPDQLTFAFYSLRSGNRDIWTMPVAGGPWKQLTVNPEADVAPRWSPDGREIAHVSSRGGIPWLWVTPRDGGEGRGLVQGNTTGVWSPDGAAIAFRINERLARITTNGRGDIAMLTRGEAVDPTWDPSGARLYFIGAGERLGNLFTVGANGAGERAVTDFRGRPGTLVPNSLATDGKFLYFAWQEDLGDLWIANLVR